MPLPQALKDGVKTEVCYLPREVHVYEMDSRENRNRTVDQDLLTIRHVKQMMQQSEPMDDAVQLHYTETLAAIDRMRQRLNRGATLEQAAFEEEKINDESDAIGENEP